MHLERKDSYDDCPSDKSADTNGLNTCQSEIIGHITRAYVRMEAVIIKDAQHLSDSGRANLRRAQGELQKLRLKMMDLFKADTVPLHQHPPEAHYDE